MRATAFLVPALVLLTACMPAPAIQLGPDGLPLPRVYRISVAEEPRVQVRVAETLNAIRAGAGVTPVQLDPSLNSAAAVHSRAMSQESRPWLFNADGTTPLDRVQRAGYVGQLRSGMVSETFETELETLAGWMEAAETRSMLLDPTARDLGVSFFQEPSGKIWWTLLTGG